MTNHSLEQLEEALISFSERMNGWEYEYLVLIREFDIRQGWQAWHFNNCAEWLNFKCGLSLGAAREKVRVAKSLFDLPLCSEAFAAGKLSYSKARALTRVATGRTESELLDFALSVTASHVEDHCRQLRNAQARVSTGDANRAHKARYLSRSIHEDGSMTISVQLSKEAADLVMKAIEIAMVSETSESEETFFQKQADALVEIARGYLAGGEHKKSSTADHYQVMVHVDEAALVDSGSDQSGKSDLPVESVRRIMCDASIVPITKNKQGDPLNMGRKQRVVSPPLKRALIGRDKCCRYPGCGHDKWLDAHHVMHWVDGGETSLSNTLLLCNRHHRLLHEGGYTIRRNFEGNWSFRTSSGKVIPEAPVFRADYYDDPDASRDGSEKNHEGHHEEHVVNEPIPIYAACSR
ncbi:MAG: DUF222 domain-containing protein [Proteobacteria bacterium]|nr:DUF222 domain-containing protein [Pseudomonadota bacterium]